MHGFIRGSASLRCAPQRAGPIDTPRREDAWLQVRALVLALALGDPQGPRSLPSLLRRPILPVDRARGRSKVVVALGEANATLDPYGTSRQPLHGAGGLQARQAPSYGIVLQGLGRDGLAQQQGRLLVRQELFQAIQRPPSTPGSEAHAQHNGPRINRPLRRYPLLDRLDQPQRVGIGLHHGPMLDRGHCDRREHKPHPMLRRRRRVGALLSYENNITLLGGAVRGKNAPGKNRWIAIRGVRNVSPNQACGRHRYDTSTIRRGVGPGDCTDLLVPPDRFRGHQGAHHL